SLLKALGQRGLLISLLGIPPAAVIMWYCWDYLTPSDFNLGISVPADWEPYQHGMTMPRYLAALVAQSCVTVSSLWRVRLEMACHAMHKKYVVLLWLGIASVAGIIGRHGS